MAVSDTISYPLLVLQALECYKARLILRGYEHRDSEALVRADQIGDSIADLTTWIGREGV